MMVNGILRFLARLKFPQLFVIVLVLFLMDLVVPDLVPLVDELILGVSTLLLASWRKTRNERREQADLEAAAPLLEAPAAALPA